MKRYLLVYFLVATQFVSYSQEKAPLQPLVELKELLCKQWQIKKVENDGKTMLMPAHIKAYMSFYSLGDFSMSGGGGETIYQKWDYIPSLKRIGLFDPKTGSDLGRLKIIKLITNEMVLYNEYDRDTVYLVRVN